MGWSTTLDGSKAFAVAAWALTFLSVIVAWVFFRAESLPGALRMLQGMAGGAPPHTDSGLLLWNAGLQPGAAITWCMVLGLAAVLLPNSNRIGEGLLAMLDKRVAWQPAAGAAALAMVVGVVLLNTARDSVSAFIYFNF